ncbi:hypothetical protein Emed_006231 [Eimeria media]
MRTQTGALWLIALGSASLGSSVKLEDGNPFQEDLDREEREGGDYEEQPFAAPSVPSAEPEPEERPPPRDETEGKIIVDRKVRSVLSKVKHFFAGKALRRKAQLAEAISRITKPQAESEATRTLPAAAAEAAASALPWLKLEKKNSIKGLCMWLADEYWCFWLLLCSLTSGLMSCIGLASKAEVTRRADIFCRRFEELTLRAMCLKTAEEAFNRMTSASAKCQNKTGSCFLKELQIPLTHPMIHRRVEGRLDYQFAPTPLPVVDIETFKWRVEWAALKELFDMFNADFPTNYAIVKQMKSLFEGLYEEANKTDSRRKRDQNFWQAWQLLVRTMQIRPHADPMMTRLLLETLALKKCSSGKIQLPGITERVNVRHVRNKLLASYFADALRLEECPENTDTANCRTIRHYARMSNTITKFYLPLNERAVINDDTPLYNGGELEASSEGEHYALREDIEEEVQSHVTFTLEVAEQITAKLVDFIARSRLARTLITAAVANIMRFAGHLREEGQEGGAIDASRAAQSELMRSAISLDATAQVEATVRELYVFVITGRRALAQVYGQVSYKVLSRELERLRKRIQPKRSLGQRIRGFFRFGRGQSSLQVENTSALMPVNAHGAMVETASTSTPRRMEASFVQNDKEKTFKRRHVYALVGATFVFLGLAVLGPVASGPLGIGLIIAGIVAMLIPLVGKLVDVVTGAIRKPKGNRPKLLALPAPPSREGEFEEDQSSQKVQKYDEAGAEDEVEGKHYDIDEVD